jgi:integrase
MVTVDFLNSYEKFMISSGKSMTTISMYVRALRALFNDAIDKGVIPADLYPFGKRRYQVPAGRNVKKALTLPEIGKIFHYQADETNKEAWARDLWLFSYLCSGINVKDMARLRYKHIDGDHIHFIRSKTERTSRRSLKPITVILTPEAKAIIDKWGIKPATPNSYVFDILPEEVTPQRELALVRQATKTINKYIARIAAAVGIDKKVSTYFARHSFATVLKRSGASIAFISEALGHSNMKTTQAYLDAFSDETKREFTKALTSFNQ